ncbi:MAG: ACT domain-containing protein [Alphaproteobacteria bacterium]
MKRLTLEILDLELAVVRLARHEPLPAWFEWRARPISSVTRTDDETSILCPAELVPPDARAERGWRAIKVRGPLEFSLTGILHSILAPLSAAEVSVFALSTYDTDYVLVRHADMPRALAALRSDFDIDFPGAA